MQRVVPSAAPTGVGRRASDGELAARVQVHVVGKLDVVQQAVLESFEPFGMPFNAAPVPPVTVPVLTTANVPLPWAFTHPALPVWGARVNAVFVRVRSGPLVKQWRC